MESQLLEIEPYQFELNAEAIERAREVVRRTWRYEPVDHVPVSIDIGPECGTTIVAALRHREHWFSSSVRRIERSLRVLLDDYVPWVGPPWAGFFAVPVMLGAPLWWEDDPNAWPAIRDPLVREIDGLALLPEVDPRRDGFMPEVLERLAVARDCFPEEVAVCGVDMTSPLGDVLNLMDQTLFFVSLKRHPEKIHRACQRITDIQIAVQEAALEVVDRDRLTAMSLWPIWRPEHAKVMVSDDVAGIVGPRAWVEFDKPYGERLIARFGGGLTHNCGPQHSVPYLMQDEPPTWGLNCSQRYSRENLPALREELGRRAEERLGRRGHLEVMFERHVALDDMVTGFRELADVLAPDVVAIPYCQVPADGSVGDDELTAFCRAMRARRRRRISSSDLPLNMPPAMTSIQPASVARRRGVAGFMDTSLASHN